MVMAGAAAAIVVAAKIVFSIDMDGASACGDVGPSRGSRYNFRLSAS